jgi:peptide/nickel transport system substrate-binding protein
MAIVRDQIIKVAMYGYTRPADATALSDAHKSWRNPQALESGDWTKLDLAKANALLDEAGCKRGEGGVRIAPDKTPLRFEVNVVTGWSDWVRAAQIIAQNLKQVGIDATLKTYDFSPYFEKLQKGEFDLSMGWTSEEPTPYHFYRGLMGSETLRPIGEVAAYNWNRFGSKEADALLRAFESTNDLAEQKKLAGQLQVLFVQNAPAIPLFPGPSWGEYSTRRFTNFPSQENPYAKLTPNSSPENLFLMVEVKPK